MDYKRLIEDLINELSYRVGIPNLMNREHQSVMSEILSEWGKIDEKYTIMSFLNEKGKTPDMNKPDSKTSGENAEYTHIGRGVYVKKGQEGNSDTQKFTKNDAGQLQPISNDEYEKMKSQQGGEGETAAASKNAATAARMSKAGENQQDTQEPTVNVFDKETLDRYDAETNGLGGESPTKIIDSVLTTFKSEKDDIISGKKTPPGTGGSAIGEMYGGISCKEIFDNPNLSEKEFITNHTDEIKSSPMSAGLRDRDIVTWLKVAYRTGLSEINELKTNSKYRFKQNQTDPYPIPVMDPVNDKGSAKKELLKLMEAKLEEAEASENEDAIKHYQRQLRFIKKRKDSDTGILYETEEGFVGFKHTSNKKSFSDTVFNSTVKVRGEVMNEATKKIATDYDLNEEEQKQITDKISTISDKALKTIEQASAGPSGIVDANVSNPIEFAEKIGVGKLFRNLDGGQSGRKDYLAEIEDEMKTNKGVGKKVNKYLADKGLQAPYTADQIAGAVLGLSKNGDITGTITKMVTKLSDNVAKVREIQKSLRKKYPNKSEDELLQLTKEQINKYKSKNAVPFDDKDISTMLSHELDWVETTSSVIKDAMKVAYDQIVTDISSADASWFNQHKPKDPQPPINGPHTQAYVGSYIKQMHWDRYILGEEEDIGDMNIAGYTVNSTHIRECLASLSNYTEDLSSKEGKEGLMSHLRKTMKINSQNQSLSFNSENGDSEIGKEQYRTKGIGNNSVLGNFGGDMQKCLKSKVAK